MYADIDKRQEVFLALPPNLCPEMLTINIIKCPLNCTEQGKIISCIDPNLNIMLTLTHTLLFQKAAKCLQLKGHLVFDIKIRRTSNYVHF